MIAICCKICLELGKMYAIVEHRWDKQYENMTQGALWKQSISTN